MNSVTKYILLITAFVVASFISAAVVLFSVAYLLGE